jgi:hypothetical protein
MDHWTNTVLKIKLQCNACKDIVIPHSNTEWATCDCGETSVIGSGSFTRIKGNNYTNLSYFNPNEIPDNVGKI